MTQEIRPESPISPEAAEYAELQAAICEFLSTNRITNASQLDSSLLAEVQVHLITCKAQPHEAISGLPALES